MIDFNEMLIIHTREKVIVYLVKFEQLLNEYEKVKENVLILSKESMEGLAPPAGLLCTTTKPCCQYQTHIKREGLIYGV